MNSRKFFFLCLLILSAVMGADYYKHRPPKKKYVRPVETSKREAVNFDDLEELTEENNEITDDLEEESEEVTKEKKSDPEDPSQEDEADMEEEGSENDADSDTENIEEDSSSSSQNSAEVPPDGSDPILFYFQNMKRNPFVESLYVKKIKAIQKAKEKEQKEVAKKEEIVKINHKVEKLNSEYSGSIELASETKAIIDSRIYGVGDIFNDLKITEIKQSIVVLKQNEDVYLIPKKGVLVNIAPDGTYTTEDNFYK